MSKHLVLDLGAAATYLAHGHYLSAPQADAWKALHPSQRVVTWQGEVEDRVPTALVTRHASGQCVTTVHVKGAGAAPPHFYRNYGDPERRLAWIAKIRSEQFGEQENALLSQCARDGRKVLLGVYNGIRGGSSRGSGSSRGGSRRGGSGAGNGVVSSGGGSSGGGSSNGPLGASAEPLDATEVYYLFTAWVVEEQEEWFKLVVGKPWRTVPRPVARRRAAPAPPTPDKAAPASA